MLRFRLPTMIALIASLIFMNFLGPRLQEAMSMTSNTDFLILLGFGAAVIISVTSITLLILSSVSMKVAKDGSYVINRETLYGKVFYAFAMLDKVENTSFCKVFWLTNLSFLALALCLAMLSAITLVILVYTSQAFTIIMATFGMMFGIAFFSLLILPPVFYLADKWKESNAKIVWHEKDPLRVYYIKEMIIDFFQHKTVQTIFVTIIFLLGIAILLVVIIAMIWGAFNVVVNFPSELRGVVYISMGSGLGFVLLLCLWYCYLSKTDAGKHLYSFYNRWACPRIKIEK